VKAPTQDEMMEAIRASLGPVPNDPGVSVAEWAKANGMSVPSARGYLERGVVSGKLIRGHARRPFSDGRISTVPVYRPA
jgi:hypothetical protein